LRIRCVGHVAKFGYISHAYKILVGKPEGKTYTQMETMTLKCVFEKWFVMSQVGFSAVQGVIFGLCELANEPLGSFCERLTIC